MLDAYLHRIGFDGVARADLPTLMAIHRAQAHAIPYEGLDIQAGVALDLDPQRIFDKLVTRRRGGWCYEMNGLLGWALAEIGFPVRRCTAGVYRRERGDAAWGNHVALLVQAGGQDWLCDLGLGDGIRAPLPLREGSHHDGPFTFRLERLADGFWRFHNHAYGSPTSFDLDPGPADEALFDRQSRFLQSDPSSHFLQNLEVVRMAADHSLTLLGKVLRRADATGVSKTEIGSAEEMTRLLDQAFGITGVNISALWPRILARHEALFGA